MSCYHLDGGGFGYNAANFQYIGLDLVFSTAAVPLDRGLVDHTWAGGFTGRTTPAVASFGANLLTAVVSWDSRYGAPTDPPPVTDSLGNTWTQLGSSTIDATTGIGVAVFYVNSQTPTTGLVHTLSWTDPCDSYGTYAFAAWYSASSWALETSNGATGLLPINTGSITPANSNELILTWAGTRDASGGSIVAAPTGFTLIDNIPNTSAGDSYCANLSAYRTDVVASTATNPQFAGTASGQRGSAKILAFTGTWTGETGETTGTLSATQESQTLAATGTVASVADISGTLSRTARYRVAVGSSAVAVRLTEQSDTCRRRWPRCRRYAEPHRTTRYCRCDWRTGRRRYAQPLPKTRYCRCDCWFGCWRCATYRSSRCDYAAGGRLRRVRLALPRRTTR